MIKVIAEIGINHNGDIKTAIDLIKAAKDAGCWAVKFQKRCPDICVPEGKKYMDYDTIWGRMPYIDYKHRIEFGKPEYDDIDKYCKKIGIKWFSSPWDEVSLDFLDQYNLDTIKIASAMITNEDFLCKVYAKYYENIIVSTGACSYDDFECCVEVFRECKNLVFLHCNSTYPMKNEDANLLFLETLIRNNMKEVNDYDVGYSGHEAGMQISIAAVALGAKYIERHITLDRTMKGSDHAASLEPHALKKLVRDCNIVESALGHDFKKYTDAEREYMKKLRYWE